MRPQKTDYLSTNKTLPQTYPPRDTHLWQVLINFDADEDVSLLDMWHAPEKTQFLRCVFFQISDRLEWRTFQRKMWQANPQRGALLPPWSPWAWQFELCGEKWAGETCLHHYTCALRCFHYRMKPLIKKETARHFSVSFNASMRQETLFLSFLIYASSSVLGSFSLFFCSSVMKTVHRDPSPLGNLVSRDYKNEMWEKQIVHNAPQNMNPVHFPVSGASECARILCISYLFILPSYAPGNGNFCLYMHIWVFWSMMIFSLLHPRTITRQYSR